MKKWKKTQHIVNKIIKNLNENIERDDLWNGRFYAKQIMCSVYNYEDGSGHSLYLYIDLIDKETKVQKLIYLDCLSSHPNGFAYKLWREMNDFIVEDIDKQGKITIDYSKINVEPITFSEWRKVGCWHGRIGKKGEV